ncbi:MAG TPA: class I SAM-dependent methyltransferase [bacterium]|nr:class I SAM-dependent methyltransferase [bacterium]
MAFYSDVVLPRLCDLAMRNRRLLPYRKRVVGSARGRVLEIGVGSGLNLPFYGPIREPLALEPAPRLIAMARRSTDANTPVTFIEASAEAIPIENEAVDTVVTTWTLCSIPHPALTLNEMRRVLRPGGRLLFVEHGLAPEENVRRWQDCLTPLWRRLSGGCHLNRPIRLMIEAGGFRIEGLETGYLPGLKMLNFTYEGSAVVT